MPSQEFVGIEKSVQMITVRHHNAWRVMIPVIMKDRLFYPFFTIDSFLLTTKYGILLFKKGSLVPEYANGKDTDVDQMYHDVTLAV